MDFMIQHCKDCGKDEEILEGIVLFDTTRCSYCGSTKLSTSNSEPFFNKYGEQIGFRRKR